MNTTLRALSTAILVVGLYGIAVAKLPPPTEAQKAAAAETKAKAAAAAEKANQELVQAQDRVVARYIAEQKAKGTTVTPQMPTSNGAASHGAAPTAGNAATPSK
jgi:hypothetical protein